MNELNMIKSGAGWLVDITDLENNDMIVLKLDKFPFHPGLQFKPVDYGGRIKDVYYAIVDYKPSMGMQVDSFNRPVIQVFRATTQVSDLVATDKEARNG